MRRIALAIIVGLLTFSASGVASLVIPEPCVGYEQSTSEDGACPPTCVTCGCCAQAAEPVTPLITSALESPIAAIGVLIAGPPSSSSRDILHVPKPRLA